jgi:Chaperone of endosialidase
MKKRNIIAVFSALACLALLPIAQAAPAPDTPIPNPPAPGVLNTRDGQSAMPFVTTGFGNSAFGAFSLFSNTDGTLNTAVGVAALDLNAGDQAAGEGVNNTAVGGAALLFNTTGSSNTAVGAGALENNDDANNNTAVGEFALFTNTAGGGHTAVGASALQNNTASGFLSSNTAVGISALITSTSGGANVAVGEGALLSVDTGSANTVIGALAGAAYNADESSNICIGAGTAGSAGDDNTIRIGDTLPSGGIDVIDGGPLANFVLIGNGLNTQGISIGTLIGFGNVSIGNGLQTTTGASTCNIGGIFNQTPPAGSHAVSVGPNNQLADATLSSRRFKKDIAPIDKISEGILALRPVTFHWKNDNTNEPEFGLVAEEVAEVNLDWITRNPQGEISGVRYETIPILLLNEFLKEHKKVEEQQANIAELKSTVAQQQKGMEVLTAQLKEQAAQIQKVSAQLEVGKPAAKVALGNQ